MDSQVTQYVPLTEVPVLDFTSLQSKLKQYIQNSIQSYNIAAPAVSISNSSEYVAVLLQGALLLCRAETLEEVKSMRFGRFPMMAAAISSDSKYLAYGGFTASVTLYDIEAEESVGDMRGHTGFIMSLVFSKSHVISGAQDGKVVYWNLESRESDLEVDVQDGYVTALAVDSENKYLFTGSSDSPIKIWRYNTNTLEGTLKGHGDRVIHLQLSSKNETLVSSSYDRTFKVWNISEQCCLFTSNCHDEWVTAVAFTPDESILVASSRDKSLSVWNTADWTLNDKLHLHQGMVAGLVCIDGKFVTASEDRTMKAISFNSSVENRIFKDRIISYRISDIFINENSFDVISAGTDGPIKKEEGNNDWEETDIWNEEQGIVSMKVLKDADTFILGLMEGALAKWNMSDSKREAVENAHDGRIVSVDVHEEKQLIVTSSDDNSVKIWNLASLQLITSYTHDDKLISAVFSSSGDKVVSRGYDAKILIYDIPSNSVLTQIPTLPTARYPETLAVSPFDQIIFSEGDPGLIHIYNLQGSLITTLQSHVAPIVGLCLTSDGKYLYSLGKDKSEKDDYVIRGHYVDNLKVWSLDEMVLLLQYTVRYDPKGLYISQNDKYVAVFSQTSEIEIFKHELGKEDKEMKFYPSDNSFIFANKLMKLLDGKEFEYSSEYKDHLILPYKINLPILYTLANDSLQLKNSLRDGAKLLKTSDGDTALSLAIKKRLRECADITLRQVGKVTVTVQPHVFELIEDLLPTLNELKLPGLSTFYINGYETVTSSSLPKYGILKSEAPVNIISATKQIHFENFAEKSAGLDNNEEALAFRVLRFRHNFLAGSQDSIDFLRSLLELDDIELFGSPAITSIILHKWNKIKHLQAIQALIYLAFLVTFSMHPYYLHDSGVVMLVVLGLNTIFYLYEIFQLTGAGIEYFYDFWNCIDMIRIVHIFIYEAYYFFIYPTDYYAKDHIFFITILTWIRALAYFRIFDTTRYLIKMIMEILKDMVPFLVILLFSTIGFAYLLLVLRVDTNPDQTFSDAFILSYRAAYGDWDLEGFQLSEWIWFFIVSAMNPLIMLNMLIAIMGDTYDRVQEMQQVADMKELCSMIFEIESVLIWRRDQGTKMHLQQCLSGDEQGDTYSDMWQGKIKAIKMQIQGINKKIDANNSVVLSVAEKLDSFEKGYRRAIKAEMNNQMQGVLQEMDKKFAGIKGEVLNKIQEVLDK
jgi:WD40 repeat protein